MPLCAGSARRRTREAAQSGDFGVGWGHRRGPGRRTPRGATARIGRPEPRRRRASFSVATETLASAHRRFPELRLEAGRPATVHPSVSTRARFATAVLPRCGLLRSRLPRAPRFGQRPSLDLAVGSWCPGPVAGSLRSSTATTPHCSSVWCRARGTHARSSRPRRPPPVGARMLCRHGDDGPPRPRHGSPDSASRRGARHAGSSSPAPCRCAFAAAYVPAWSHRAVQLRACRPAYGAAPIVASVRTCRLASGAGRKRPALTVPSWDLPSPVSHMRGCAPATMDMPGRVSRRAVACLNRPSGACGSAMMPPTPGVGRPRHPRDVRGGPSAQSPPRGDVCRSRRGRRQPRWRR